MATAIQQFYIVEINKVNDFKHDFDRPGHHMFKASLFIPDVCMAFKIVRSRVFRFAFQAKWKKKVKTKNSPGKSTVTNRVTLRGILRGVKN